MASFGDLLAQKQPRFQTHQALLLVGLQNDFCSSSGKLPVTEPAGLLLRIRELIPAFRENAGEIIWIRTEFRPDHPVDEADDADAVVTHLPGEDSRSDEDETPELTADALLSSDPGLPGPLRGARCRPTDLLERISARNRQVEDKDEGAARSEDELFLTKASAKQVCLAGSSGADWADDIASEIKPQDIVVTKTRYSALKSTSLLLTLRAKLITELYVCGCISNISVYATAAEAARHGLTIYLVDDCVGYRRLDRHQEALRQMVEFMGVHTVSSLDLILQLTGQSEKGDDTAPQRSADIGDDDLEDMLKNLKIKDRNRSAGPSTSRSRKAEASTCSAKGAAVSAPSPVPSTGLPQASSEEVLVDCENLGLLERPSARSQTANPQQEPSRGSGSVKSKVRMRRRPGSKNSPSPADSTASKPKEDDKGMPGAVKSEQMTKATTPILKNQASSSDNLKTSMPSSRTPPSTADDGTAHPKSRPSGSQSPHATQTLPAMQKTSSKVTSSTLGPPERIGEGDSRIVHDFLPHSLRCPGEPEKALSDDIFHKLYNGVRWQRMMHAQGEVPRLVAVQGEFGEDGSMPIFRHPSDQSLPLLHFSPAVLLIRKQVEELIQHPVNHVLIQLYRSSQDYISEHSDKTLDIVRGSSIVNVSFGAQRTMRLRTKRSAKSDQAEDELSSARQTQRVTMPHNSAFVLGQETNTRWLHGITADKRTLGEKLDVERDFAGMRISLTFRHIGTFLDRGSSKIWGQGATSKDKPSAKGVANGDEKRTEELIRAFSKENKSTEFDWEGTYGQGFDVLHFRDAPPELPMLFVSNSRMERQAVLLYIQELGLKYALVEPPMLDPAFERDRQICLRDTDAKHAEVCGTVLVLTYLEKYYSDNKTSKDREDDDDRAITTAAHTYLSHASHLYRLWTAHSDAANTANLPPSFSHTLSTLEEIRTTDRPRTSSPFLAGPRFSIADCALWPLLKEVQTRWEGWSTERYPALAAYQTGLARGKEEVSKFCADEGKAAVDAEIESEETEALGRESKEGAAKEGEGRGEKGKEEKGKGKAR